MGRSKAFSTGKTDTLRDERVVEFYNHISLALRTSCNNMIFKDIFCARKMVQREFIIMTAFFTSSSDIPISKHRSLFVSAKFLKE